MAGLCVVIGLVCAAAAVWLAMGAVEWAWSLGILGVCWCLAGVGIAVEDSGQWVKRR